MKLYDYSGKLIKEYTTINKTNFLLNLKKLAKGLYFIEVNLENGTSLKKKIIKI